MKRSTKRRLKQAWRRDGEWISMALVTVALMCAGVVLHATMTL